MIEIIEIILAIVVISGSIVWLSEAIDKFNRLKSEHKQYVKEFVKLINGKDASDDVKQR